MEIYEFGDPGANIVLIQPVDEHDLEGIENEISAISAHCKAGFHMRAVKIKNWNKDLSPWEAPPAFGKDSFGCGAEDTLKKILELCSDKDRTYYIGGYSLAGLFALWASYNTDVFEGVAAASPSMWFPGFTEYMKEHEIKASRIYLSLGDREEKTGNPVMADVGKRMREAYILLKDRVSDCILEWNEGNHFRDADIRTARAFTWVTDSYSC